MNYYYITGSSRGIGKAIAELLLKTPDNKVYGMSRDCSLDHKNYEHITMDLADINKIKAFSFGAHIDAQRLVLINNAGTLGDIKYVGNLSDEAIMTAYHINLVAPGILMNKFINAYKEVDLEKIIINVSSGAGQNAVDGWSVYCSTKAGLDMFSRVVDREQMLKNIKHPIKILSVAPGIVDTQMQGKIRKVTKENFSNLEQFIAYKEQEELVDPCKIAEKYLYIINNITEFKETVCSVRESN